MKEIITLGVIICMYFMLIIGLDCPPYIAVVSSFILVLLTIIVAKLPDSN